MTLHAVVSLVAVNWPILHVAMHVVVSSQAYETALWLLQGHKLPPPPRLARMKTRAHI